MRILLCLAALFFANAASAKCMAQHMSYWPPPNATIDARPTILIEGMGGHQATVKALKGASLVAPGHRVALAKIATNEGAFRVTQTVWIPEKALRPGTTYTLVVQGRSKTWRPTGYVADTSRKQRHEYTVAKAPRPALAWTGAPTVGESSAQAFGCGPSIHQAVTLPTNHTDGLVEVTVARAPAARTYLLPLSKAGTLSLGHGMCAGPFQVGGAGTYTASFALVDGGAVDPGSRKSVTFSGVTGE